MTALAIATGTKTYFGRTAKLVEEAKTKSHFQKAVIKIGDYLIAFAIALIVLIFLVAMFRQESLLQTLQFALVLLIAAIPAAPSAVLLAVRARWLLAIHYYSYHLYHLFSVPLSCNSSLKYMEYVMFEENDDIKS